MLEIQCVRRAKSVMSVEEELSPLAVMSSVLNLKSVRRPSHCSPLALKLELGVPGSSVCTAPRYRP